jgi:hypothetical protein
MTQKRWAATGVVLYRRPCAYGGIVSKANEIETRTRAKSLKPLSAHADKIRMLLIQDTVKHTFPINIFYCIRYVQRLTRKILMYRRVAFFPKMLKVTYMHL